MRRGQGHQWVRTGHQQMVFGRATASMTLRFVQEYLSCEKVIRLLWNQQLQFYDWGLKKGVLNVLCLECNKNLKGGPPLYCLNNLPSREMFNLKLRVIDSGVSDNMQDYTVSSFLFSIRERYCEHIHKKKSIETGKEHPMEPYNKCMVAQPMYCTESTTTNRSPEWHAVAIPVGLL